MTRTIFFAILQTDKPAELSVPLLTLFGKIPENMGGRALPPLSSIYLYF